MLAVPACQTTADGVERGHYYKVPPELSRLSIDDTGILTKIGAARQARSISISTSRSAAYFETFTLSGGGHKTYIRLSMLPHGWYWNVHSSGFGLQKELRNGFDKVLKHDIDISDVTPLSTDYARSVYGRFRQGVRECYGFLITSSASALPNNYRNLVVGASCAAPDQLMTDQEFMRLVLAISFDPAHYSGAGFSSEQVRYVAGKS